MIDLKLDGLAASDPVINLWLNGQLVAEVCVCALHATRDKLQLEVARARRLESLPVILRDLFGRITRQMSYASEGLSRDAAEVEWIEGMKDGLRLMTCPDPSPALGEDRVVYPHMLVHRFKGRSERPNGPFSFAYKCGYEWGYGLRRGLDSIDELAKKIE